MILRLDIERLRTLDEIRNFMTGSEPVDFRFVSGRPSRWTSCRGQAIAPGGGGGPGVHGRRGVLRSGSGNRSWLM